MAPPILNGEGAKAQQNWLFGFLKQPVPLRPWLKVRMPTFSLSDDETNDAGASTSWRSDNIQVPFVHVDESKIPPDYIEAAKNLTTPDYFNCFSCHQQGDHKPEGPPEGWAPDLAHGAPPPQSRLDPGLAAQSAGAAAGHQDAVVLQGDDDVPRRAGGHPGRQREKQIEALRDYVLTLHNDAARRTQPPAGRAGAQR